MEVVEGRENFIIFVMVDDIQVDDLPKVIKAFVKTRTYIDARDINNQKDLDLFRKKLQYSMPQTPLKDVPKVEADPEGRNPNFPPQFNRLNRYGGYNRRMNVREEIRLRDIGEGRKEAAIEEEETVL